MFCRHADFDRIRLLVTCHRDGQSGKKAWLSRNHACYVLLQACFRGVDALLLHMIMKTTFSMFMKKKPAPPDLLSKDSAHVLSMITAMHAWQASSLFFPSLDCIYQRCSSDSPWSSPWRTAGPGCVAPCLGGPPVPWHSHAPSVQQQTSA